MAIQSALAEDCLVVALEERASALSIPGWPSPPREATVLPIRLRERSEAAGFLVLGLHPGRAFDDTYRQFVRRIAEQIAIGLASARAYEQERQRAEALAEIDRAKTAFFSNVSHEFRTPLALMLGPLEEVLPEAREQLSPERHEQLVTVRRNAFRLLKLVNTLLDFSRIEAGRVQAAYEPTDLASVTSGIASVFRSAMENAGLRFSVECPPLAEPVYVDRDMWEKVVSNLLSNAFKFTFEGAVTVTLKSVDGAVELQVRDTGVGIPEDQRTRVFERFHRIEGTQARTYEGTGIGLALVQELIKLHSGHVRVESTVGQGSTFIVTIPLRHGAFAGGAHSGRAIGRVDWNCSRRICRGGTAVVAGRLEHGGRHDASQSLVACTFAVARTGGETRSWSSWPMTTRTCVSTSGTCWAARYEVHAVSDGRQAMEADTTLAARPGAGRRHDAATGWIRCAASHSRRRGPRQHASHPALRAGGRRVASGGTAGRRRRLPREAVYGAGTVGADPDGWR